MNQNEFELRKKVVEDPEFRRSLAMDTMATLNNNGFQLSANDIRGLDLDLDFRSLSQEDFRRKLEQDLKCVLVNTIVICTFRESNETL
jgi:hypothetical protein